MSSSTSIESLGGSSPNDGEECLSLLNPIIDLDANTNEEPLTNEATPANEAGNEENVENNDVVIQKAKRKKTSPVWDHFKEVELKNGTKKWQCLHCKRNYVVVASGSTSHLKRHLREVCHVYKKLAAQQQKLNLKPTKSMIDEKLSGPLLMNPSAKYDHERQREATAHWVMMHEQPFSIFEKVCKLLEVFNSVTNIISGSEYPTANLYLAEVFRIKQVVDKAVQDESNFMKVMANAMNEKFDKYWSQCNLVMSLASVLDPRIKLMGVNMCFPLIYPGDQARKNIAKVHKTLNDMYQEYADMLQEHGEEGSSRTSADQSGLILEPTRASGWSKLMNVKEQQAIPAVKSEVEEYLNEPTYKPNDNGHMSFCALEWWKLNRGKYRVLSHMAADVLAIPISTVASESTFSAGGRVIDSFRASLHSSTVETLIYGGDWLRVLHGIRNKPKVEQVPTEITLFP